MDRFATMLEMQLQLQRNHMKDGDPQALTGDAMAEFMTWNFAACVKELSEATDEVGWKPWATSRHLSQPQFNREMVDAFHFFMNMLLVANPFSTAEMIARDFFEYYCEKNAVNAQRQIDGYDGVQGKCWNCHREVPDDTQYCSPDCAAEAGDVQVNG